MRSDPEAGEPEHPLAGALPARRWPPAGASARARSPEHHEPARIAGDGVVFGLWCGAHRVVGFVTADALAALAGRALEPSQWLATYKAEVRKIHGAARAEAASGADPAEPLVVTASAFA